MKKVYLVNAFTQTLEALYLDELIENKKEIVEIARECTDIVGRVDDNVIIRIVNNKSLSIKIAEKSIQEVQIFCYMKR